MHFAFVASIWVRGNNVALNEPLATINILAVSVSVIDWQLSRGYIGTMTPGLIRRLTALMMALAILIVAVPMLPASAATNCCDQMGMSMSGSMSMTMDMKSSPAKSHQTPAKPGLPCNESLNCMGGAGCAAPAFSLISVPALLGIGILDANWTSQLAGPSVAYKPALPPPIALA